MTVRDIFELRKQGKIEEAYDAIRPMYAAHKGRYTSLCMFWTAADIFKKRLREGRTDEAAKIYEALKRVLPYIKDSDKQPETTLDFHDDGTPKLGIDKEPSRTTDSAAAFMQTAARRLTQARQLDKQQALAKSKQENSSNSTRKEFSAISALSASQKEALSNSCNSCSKTDQEVIPSSEKDNSSNSPLKEAQDDNLSSGENISAVSALSASKKEPSASEEAILSSEKDNSRNSQNSPLKEANEDLSGHLSVSLDEGIIRPIEGLTAIQRVVLACVVGHPGYSATKISESTGIPQSLIDCHVAVLIDRGLIEPRKGELNTAEYYPI